MRVPDFVLRCVGFLGESYGAIDGSDFEPTGTAFIVTMESFYESGGHYWYLITAKHLVEGKPFPPTLALNSANRDERILLDSIPIDGGPHWYCHPDGATDVAVTPVLPVLGIDILTIPCQMLLTPRKIEMYHLGIGDDVFFPGCFEKAIGSKRNTPALRRGNLAMLPTEPVQIVLENGDSKYMEVYLIESHSIGGLSGSPVFVRETVRGWGKNARGKRAPLCGVSGCERLGFHLLGVNSGHFKIDGVLGVEHAGMSYIMPSHKILETLDLPELKQARVKNELRILDRARASRD